MSSENFRRCALVVGLLLGAALLGLLLVPYATNGLWFDDSLNGQIRPMLDRFGEDVWSFSLRICARWIHAGRLLLAWPWLYSFFYKVYTPWAIRLTDLAFLLAHVALVVLLLRRLAISWPRVALFLLILFSLFQIQHGDDPIAAYATFCQILGMALTLSFLLLLHWRRTGSLASLTMSAVIAGASLLFYELNIVYFPIAFAVIWTAGLPPKLFGLPPIDPIQARPWAIWAQSCRPISNS